MIQEVNFSEHNNVFCDSLEALDWAYQQGLSSNASIHTCSPAMLCDKKKNIHNIEARWTVDELKKFQGVIQKLTEDIFDAALSVVGVERELALAVSQSAYQFQKIIYKAACLDVDDFTNSRLFIYVDGKTGPAGNIMNSPWGQLLSSNQLFSTVSYTLKNDEWKMLTTQGVSYWKRFRVAGYETIIYRLAIKLMKKLPNWMFKKEIIVPNENELNIEIVTALVLHGVKVSKIKLGSMPNTDNTVLDENTVLLYEAILPIMYKRIEEWVTPSAVEVTMSLFEAHLEKQLKKFKSLVFEWEKVIVKSDNTRRAVLINTPGNINGQALSYVCRKNSVFLMSSQHGVTIEISKAHNALSVGFDNSVSDVIFSYNSKIIEIEKNTYFDKSKHYSVGMPLRNIRMKYSKIIDKLIPPIIYISTNLYSMGLSLSSKTDYGRAVDEQNIVSLVLSRLPHKVRYKTYPEDNRRYADIDPVFSIVKQADNIELFDKKIDMRYLVADHSIFITTCATSTLSWPIMSGKPVIFINQKNNNPLTDDAYVCFSKGIFVFDDDEKNFHYNLREFLSQPLDKIERLWQEKKSARRDMIREYFNAYPFGAGVRAAKIIIQEYL